MDNKAAEIIRDQGVLQSDRGIFESHWEEIAERVLPRSSRVFFQRGQNITQGEKKTEKMLDAKAALALDRYVAVLHSLLTPSSQKWHRLKATDPVLNRVPRVRRYYDQLTDILFRHRYQWQANYDEQQVECYYSAGAFGTYGLYIDWRNPTMTDPVGGLRYRACHLSELFVRTNHQGMIDAPHRKFPLTARQANQMLQEGVIESLPKQITDSLSKHPDKTFDFIHCVKPRNDVMRGRLDYRGKPWASYYVAVDGAHMCGEGGYNSFPFSFGRGPRSPGEVYGRSPAMTVLPNIKVLNEQKRTMLKQGHRLVEPVLLAHDDGVVDTFSLKPGSINAGGVDSQGRKLVQRLDDNVGQLPQLQEMMNDERGMIDDAFLLTLFQILVETPQMTATEVLERTREKAILMAPQLVPYQSQAHGAQIERELELLASHGKLPPAPPEIVEAGGEYVVDYDSPLNRAMKAEELSGFMRLTEVATQVSVATQDPSALDHLDFDEAIPEMADAMAVPARWIRLPKDVEARREARQQQQATQTLIDAAPSAAAMMKAGATGG